MSIPFEYGEIVHQLQFVNREVDKKRLQQNLVGGINTMLISPRRWGKSSLVKQVAHENKNKKVKFCFIDLFNMADEQEFYENLAKEVIKCSNSKLDEWLKTIQGFFKTIQPKISFGLDPMNDFKLTFTGKNIQSDYQEILDLAENIAKQKKIKIIVCIDEFQNLSKFSDPLLFQQKLRASWQHHKHVSYCLYGSKRHMMMDIFQNKSMPFYKFGDVFFLQKISTNHWKNYIIRQFESTKKAISEELAEKIAITVQNHSYYVQQFAHLVWVRTNKKVTDEILEDALNDLLNQNALLYNREMEDLSKYQINFLKALANKEKSFHSSEIIQEYRLGTSSNVTRIKDALEKKEIIDIQSKKVTFLDPAFELWFKRLFKI